MARRAEAALQKEIPARGPQAPGQDGRANQGWALGRQGEAQLGLQQGQRGGALLRAGTKCVA
jgi:hypothetical protein